ncbi:MAG TPA: hypothetical protein VJH04_00175 [archaeon]|nr:hypothetical protein [archaeon]
MTAKNVRNLILTLIILAIGVKLILWISGNYIGSSGQFSDLVAGFAGLGDLAMYGLILLAILLIPYYLSKRSQERKRSGY